MRPEDQVAGTSPYLVIPRTLVFITRGDRLLLLRGAPNKRLWANKYNGVGGHLEPGESPYASAVREVREETGLVVDALSLRALIHVTLPQPPGVILFVFVGEVSDGKVIASEEGQCEWITRDQLGTLPLVEDLPMLLPRVLGDDVVTYGTYVFTDEGLQIQYDQEI